VPRIVARLDSLQRQQRLQQHRRAHQQDEGRSNLHDGENPQAARGAAGDARTAAPPADVATVSPADELKNTVGDRVFFALDKSALTDEGKATLDRESAWLAKYPSVSLQLAGNCDERGTEEYNLALGNRRAVATKDYLVAKGVDASRLATISYGKDMPTATGSNEQAWAQNRNTISSVK